MMMEDRTTVTDRHGKFKFDHALAGSHDVGFDMSNLPATLDPVNKDQTIVVQQGKTANVLFSAYRIGSVTGTIGVGADAFGKVDPTAGIGIVITDERGNETTSGINQSFLLGGEPLGKHYISIVASSLPPGYSVSGDQTQQVTVIAGTTTPVLAFQIVPKIQPVQMNDLSQ